MREAVAEAPGRVNLIGEHTDYHQGYVLPSVIPQRTRVHLVARSDRRVRASSREIGGDIAEFVIGAETVTHTWLDYIQGVTHTLRALTTTLPGFDLRVESDIPLGSGLSSSAALEVSLLRALRELYDLPVDDVELARIAQRAETEFVGAPVGIMDQMVCSLGHPREAFFLDTRTLSYERVPLPPAAELVVINSGVRHQHAGGEYTIRRRESFEAAAMLGVSFLRDVTIDELARRITPLPDTLARRARHIVSENHRVQDTVIAIAAGDLVRVGALFYASHGSMRVDYEISTPEIDALVELGHADADVYGARLTGGGFGGSVVMLAKAGCGAAAACRILDLYAANGDRHGSILLPNPILGGSQSQGSAR
jgi:galactokinase